MPALRTDAVVLHMFDYLETSRILKLATREAGVQSVLARGARTSKKRFGSALGLFAEGQAQIQVNPGRELHTLAPQLTPCCCKPGTTCGSGLGRSFTHAEIPTHTNNMNSVSDLIIS